MKEEEGGWEGVKGGGRREEGGGRGEEGGGRREEGGSDTPTSAAETLSFWQTSASTVESICVASLSPGRGKR